MSQTTESVFDLGKWWSILSSANGVSQLVGPLLQDYTSILLHLTQRENIKFDDDGQAVSYQISQAAPELLGEISSLTAKLQNGQICENEFQIQGRVLIGKVASEYGRTDGNPVELERLGAYVYAIEKLLDVPDANATFARQMSVLYMTYAEIIVKDFFFCLFSARPGYIYELIKEQKKSGDSDLSEPINNRHLVQVGLNELMKAKDIQSIINTIIDRNVSYAIRGTYKEQAKRIEKMTKHSISKSLVDALDKAYIRRNRIVHQGADDNLSLYEVNELWSTVHNLCIELGKIAQACGVPVHDPGHWLVSN